MAFGGFSEGKHMAPMADINVTPMVDVMLVLLVIFIMTAPFFTHSIKLELPKTQSTTQTQPEPATVISVDAEGKIYWADEKQALSEAELDTRLTQLATDTPDGDLQLRADKATRYEVLAHIMASAQQHNLHKLAFITDPTPTTSKETQHGPSQP